MASAKPLERLLDAAEGSVESAKMDFPSEDESSSEESSNPSSEEESSSSEEDASEQVVGETSYSKKEKEKPTPSKTPAKASTALTECDEMLMHKEGLAHEIRIFRTTKESAKMPSSSDTNHVDFFSFKDVHANFNNFNPRLRGDFAESKRHFKCKNTNKKLICLPVWVIDNVLDGIKKGAQKTKKTVKELFKKGEPVPFVKPPPPAKPAKGTKRKLENPETPRPKKSKKSSPKKPTNNIRVEEEFDIVHAALPFAFKFLPADDKRDLCTTLSNSIAKAFTPED